MDAKMNQMEHVLTSQWHSTVWTEKQWNSFGSWPHLMIKWLTAWLFQKPWLMKQTKYVPSRALRVFLFLFWFGSKPIAMNALSTRKKKWLSILQIDIIMIGENWDINIQSTNQMNIFNKRNENQLNQNVWRRDEIENKTKNRTVLNV